MNSQHKEILQEIEELRLSMSDDLNKIEQILKKHFVKEYHVAYQHWIPQILTALYNNTKWLSRGQYSLQNTIDHILDKDNQPSGVTKYIGEDNG